MKSCATVRLSFQSEKILKVVLDALNPETKKAVTRRSKIFVQSEGTNLILKVEARDTVALRAALNSYLRWISLINDACFVVSSIS